MAKFTHTPSKKTKELPKKREHASEFKKGKAEYIICPACSSVYYNKSWHHSMEGDKHFTENKNVNFTVCPADKMIKAKQFEGQIVLENVPEILRGELFSLIENMGEHAFRRDPMDRVISIRDEKDTIEILTTENQLAVSIAKKIRDSFKDKMRGKLEIKFSEREDPVRIIWKSE
ncbi:hypothetical protein A2833_00310 [Candidatus Azambacteria bacterium RIFCSPHIGHO2_01_FULL_44_55]|uniref:Nmd3 N-terminal domain-containing protein n=1 Tax=Candidatus Azambacteria bacterium RIFCSPLOWO2_02_FULL_44_14 TaxID=1797306 RepID=A0A1F5CBL7_9BACT|nr:MAG: hypothetical protein A3A18_00655 [Candidatus Azambacteria bacterium RIFCSPLOWO2_01_FULL_44_84]OGD32837.1 MAG: hypothetical protein A3C78_03510 [Candidatus Azambacteria bacterium RIFCSPHIGHO2_02_FULL_45_18]OGD40224.1 MAG: hypothetical protein A3I30_03080 [Candidatus Azambacteria bacterium RIFCSPLOWO2_02_FULL_44_14]OGD41617.1 MAG: hypothetical protein A2833_00310 [Candidatus Azambacteria bacterium RIFCSPHIGHO2_01_FULL_44_55]OGD51182.1 MAG: hypothetical protein A2608_01730 [Candidatus Azam